jgi:hypothetical protein
MRRSGVRSSSSPPLNMRASGRFKAPSPPLFSALVSFLATVSQVRLAPRCHRLIFGADWNFWSIGRLISNTFQALFDVSPRIAHASCHIDG